MLSTSCLFVKNFDSISPHKYSSFCFWPASLRMPSSQMQRVFSWAVTLWKISGTMKLSVGLCMSRITKVDRLTPKTFPPASTLSTGMTQNLAMFTFVLGTGLAFQKYYFVLIKYGDQLYVQQRLQILILAVGELVDIHPRIAAIEVLTRHLTDLVLFDQPFETEDLVFVPIYVHLAAIICVVA
jgi:hypothetical protein